MTRTRPLVLLTVGALGLGTIALAQTATDAIKFRQAHMTLLSANLGVLGGMARGTIDYDAATAQTFADSLAAVAGLDQSLYWPEGTAQGEMEGTKALPAIWEDPEDFAEDRAALVDATRALVEVAGTGLDPLKEAMGPIGAACGACHETFRSR